VILKFVCDILSRFLWFKIFSCAKVEFFCLNHPKKIIKFIKFIIIFILNFFYNGYNVWTIVIKWRICYTNYIQIKRWLKKIIELTLKLNIVIWYLQKYWKVYNKYRISFWKSYWRNYIKCTFRLWKGGPGKALKSQLKRWYLETRNIFR
jgi:hypothetical protein